MVQMVGFTQDKKNGIENGMDSRTRIGYGEEERREERSLLPVRLNTFSKISRSFTFLLIVVKIV
jgi:hypothetical protein